MKRLTAIAAGLLIAATPAISREGRMQPCQYNGGKWIQVEVSSNPFHLKWDDGPQMTYTWVGSNADRWNIIDKLGGRWQYYDHRNQGGFTLTNIDNGNKIKCLGTNR